MFLQQQAQQPGPIFTALLWFFIIGIFYFVVFRPSLRQRKQLQQLIDKLKVGDKVITSGGIYGTIVGFKDDRIQLRIAENVKIELSRNAVTALQQPEQQE